jgi:hypothetical protein
MVWPKTLPAAWAAERAIKSLAPPGENGTMNFICFNGQLALLAPVADCANAAPPSKLNATNAPTRAQWLSFKFFTRTISSPSRNDFNANRLQR